MAKNNNKEMGFMSMYL